jgi:ubiquinone/menaquinone biosynthesis C-methylase UbiE
MISLQVIGIDPDLERLELARKKYTAQNLEYLQGRAESIPGDGYDMVYSNYVLHWCEDKELVFKQVHKCLKPGGKFGFVASTYSDFTTLIPSDMISTEYKEATTTMYHPPTMDEFKRHLANNNFEILSVEEKEKKHNMGNVDKLIDAMMFHTHGKFDRTHFNVDALNRHFGEGDISFSVPSCVAVVSKN